MGAATSQISYTATKGGVLAMSRELGVQFAREGIRVNALCPGPVDTPLLRELFAKDPERAARRLVHIPMGRFARAGRDRRRGRLPRQRRLLVHHRHALPGRRRHHRRVRHAAVSRPLIGITAYVEPAGWAVWRDVPVALVPQAYVRQVLVQGAAGGDREQLHAPADAEHRQVGGERAR